MCLQQKKCLLNDCTRPAGNSHILVTVVALDAVAACASGTCWIITGINDCLFLLSLCAGFDLLQVRIAGSPCEWARTMAGEC